MRQGVHRSGVRIYAGGEKKNQIYVRGQKKNQAVNATETRAAVKLPLTTLSAIPLICGEVLVVATAASVATITNATAIIRKIMSIMAVC